jgi:hypothetical protein
MKEKYIKPLTWSIIILLAVGYLFSVRPVLNFLMTKAKEQGETALLVSMREHAQNDLFWNFTGTPTPLDELWPIK